VAEVFKGRSKQRCQCTEGNTGH